jgi:hypothetical protein
MDKCCDIYFRILASCDFSDVYEEIKQFLHNVHMSQFVK